MCRQIARHVSKRFGCPQMLRCSFHLFSLADDLFNSAMGWLASANIYWVFRATKS